MHLDKEDTRRNNLNSKYLSVTLCVKKYPDSFICFYPAAGKFLEHSRIVDLLSLRRSWYQQYMSCNL